MFDASIMVNLAEEKFYIVRPDRMTIAYAVPGHLEDCDGIEEMHTRDLVALGRELHVRGSSVDGKIGEKKIWRMGFPGMVVDAREMNYAEGELDVRAVPIHPHRADLAYRGDGTLERNVNVVTVNAVLESKEGCAVVGIRGGDVEGGKIGVIPGGHLEYPATRIIGGLLAESEEELGYRIPGEFGETDLVGVFPNKDTNGVNFLYVAKTNLGFDEIRERWMGAQDRGEHTSLLQLERDEIGELAQEGKLRIGQKEISTTPFFQDCFAHYLNHTD